MRVRICMTFRPPAPFTHFSHSISPDRILRVCIVYCCNDIICQFSLRIMPYKTYVRTYVRTVSQVEILIDSYAFRLPAAVLRYPRMLRQTLTTHNNHTPLPTVKFVLWRRAK